MEVKSEDPYIPKIRALAILRDEAWEESASDSSKEEVQWHIERCSTTVFQPYHLYRVERWVLWSYVTWYLGWATGDDAYWLEGDEEAFFSLAHAAGVRLESVATIWEYVQWYLLITQPKKMYEEFFLIESVEQICFRDKVDMDMEPFDMLRKEHFLEQYRTYVNKPHIHHIGQSATVDVFATRNNSLEAHHLLVSRDGRLHHTVRIVERDLPIAVAGGVSTFITGYTSRES